MLNAVLHGRLFKRADCIAPALHSTYVDKLGMQVNKHHSAQCCSSLSVACVGFLLTTKGAKRSGSGSNVSRCVHDVHGNNGPHITRQHKRWAAYANAVDFHSNVMRACVSVSVSRRNMTVCQMYPKRTGSIGRNGGPENARDNTENG